MSTRQNHHPSQGAQPFGHSYDGGQPPLSYSNEAMRTMNSMNPMTNMGYPVHSTQPPPQLQQPQQLQPPPPHPPQLHPTQNAPPPKETRRSTSATIHQPFEGVKGKYKYKLEVRQQPTRARMCGFGDKDRRPITSPPCIRLIVEEGGKEVDYEHVDPTFFILGVDLWDDTGTREVNMVRHASGTSNPSIGSTTLTSYPPPLDQRGPSYTMAPAPLGSYGAAPLNVNPPYQQHQHQQQPPPAPPNFYQGPAPGYPAYQPVPAAQNYPAPPAAYPPSQVTHQVPHPPPAAGAVQSWYAPPPAPGPPQPVAPPPQSTTLSMFTRNLIGTCHVSASKLLDDHETLGIWFVLQDLSVRTEGTFRLRINLLDISKTGTSATGLSGLVLNKGLAPVIASCFSDVFTVYSAKKFPGVIESTALSKRFAQQGIKIPIRKDQARIANQHEYDEDEQ